MKYAFVAGLAFFAALRAEDYYPRKSVEVGYERSLPANRRPDTAGTGILFNYYPARVFHIGTTQNIVSTGPGYARSDFIYRPDVHIGFTIPLLESLFAELTAGIDLFTGLVAAAFILSDNKQSLGSTSGYGGRYMGYFNFATALRWHWDALALKVIAQMQYGGYPTSMRDTMSSSGWLGLGATYRFKL